MKKKILYCLALILIALVLDQWLKIWVKTTFYYREEHDVMGSWFKLHFIENNGFAFGTEFGGRMGKLFLTLFRLVAVSIMGVYIYSLAKSTKVKYRLGYLMMISLIMAGALGNIIDSVFYGMIFSESPLHGQGVAVMFPEGGGYESIFHGKVVDMLYFPLYKGFVPDWVPVMGGDYFEFFRPVFNIADSCITIGVLAIILFYRRELKVSGKRDENPKQEAAIAAVDTGAHDTEQGTMPSTDEEAERSTEQPPAS